MPFGPQRSARTIALAYIAFDPQSWGAKALLRLTSPYFAIVYQCLAVSYWRQLDAGVSSGYRNLICGLNLEGNTLVQPQIKQSHEPAPVTQLQGLHHDREGVTHALADLNRAAARLRETGATEASALAEINAMAAADIASMTKWATEGCHGDAPRSDQQKRIVLGQKLKAAQAA